MIKAIALFAILCGSLFIYGFLASDRLRVTWRAEERNIPFTVTVTSPRITEDHRWVSLYGCSAELVDNVVHCDGFWEVQSTHPMRIDQAQYPFPLRGTPKRGTLQFTAMTFDGNNKPLGRGQTLVMR
jgi:hypothetical protein